MATIAVYDEVMDSSLPTLASLEDSGVVLYQGYPAELVTPGTVPPDITPAILECYNIDHNMQELSVSFKHANDILYITPSPVPPAIGAWGNGHFTFNHIIMDAKQYPSTLVIDGVVGFNSSVFEFADGEFISYVK